MTKGHLRVRIPNPHRGDIGGHLLRAILREAGDKSSQKRDIKRAIEMTRALDKE